MNIIFQFSSFWLEYRCVDIWLRAAIGPSPEHCLRTSPGVFSLLYLVRVESLPFICVSGHVPLIQILFLASQLKADRPVVCSQVPDAA